MAFKYSLLYICLICGADLWPVEADVNSSVTLENFERIGNKYYWIVDNAVNWWNAYFTCRQHRSSLARIDSINDLTILSERLVNLNSGRDPNQYWIGGTDLGAEGTFQWMDNGAIIPRSNIWRTGQPDNAFNEEHCVHLSYYSNERPNYKLNDFQCSHTRSYICERESPRPFAFVTC